MSCRHVICYGFKIFTSGESTITVFNILMRHFEILPKFIVYDNACNLHNTCLIRSVLLLLYNIVNVIKLKSFRDPTAFRNSTFLIDRFHSTNHKCNRAIQCQIFEQETLTSLILKFANRYTQGCDEFHPS